MVVTQLCFDDCMLWSSLCVEISTLSYEAKILSLPERSLVYCTYINVTFKNQRYSQVSMFTATGGPTDVPLVVLG